MNTTTLADHAGAAPADSAAVRTDATSERAWATNGGAPRHDLYAPIHKGLRHFMNDTLLRVGRVDVGDAADLQPTLGQLDALLDVCAEHLQHENAFIHPAIEARRPSAAARTAADHAEHLASIAALRDEAAALVAADAAARAPLALRLYRHLALFVAENLQHMQIEETVNTAALWAHYSDAELDAIHGRLLASIPPQRHLQLLRWIVPALSPVERAGMLNAMKLQASPEAFVGVLAHVEPHLDAAAWRKLACAVGVSVGLRAGAEQPEPARPS